MMALLSLPTLANEQQEGEALNIPEIVLHHLADAYEWHIVSDVSIPLPIIIRSSQTGEWHFCTAHSLPNGFFFNEEAHGKIYERMADGTTERPWDLSITRNVLQIWIVVALLLTVFLCCARWYKKHDKTSDAPSGFVGVIEMLVMMINDSVIKSSIGEKHYRKYAPYLLTVFFFIFFTNLLGLLPIFPGGSNVTGNINITFFLAICTFLAINLFGNKEYWKEILWPEVPMMMKCPVPLMPVVEIIGIFTKPFALMMRLFANMFGGHTVIISLTCLIFITWKVSAGMGASMTAVSFLMLIFMNCLELLVAFLQAYVFTMLSSVYIGLAHPEHHK